MSKATAALPRDVAEVRHRLRFGHRKGHYYVALLGLRTYDPVKIHTRVQHGLSFSAFERFQKNTDLSARLLAEITLIPERTLARRKEEGRLDPGESDRLVRASRVFGRALELFEGDMASARRWLSRSQPALGGVTPLELATTDIGAKEVEDLIGRLEHGIPS